MNRYLIRDVNGEHNQVGTRFEISERGDRDRVVVYDDNGIVYVTWSALSVLPCGASDPEPEGADDGGQADGSDGSDGADPEG
jgi:hypothetical protein